MKVKDYNSPLTYNSRENIQNLTNLESLIWWGRGEIASYMPPKPVYEKVVQKFSPTSAYVFLSSLIKL